VAAAEIAAEEFGNNIDGAKIEIISADHQNKPDIGAAIASRWFDVEHVDAIADLINSALAFAVLNVAKERGKLLLLTSAASADFTGKACGLTILCNGSTTHTRPARRRAKRCLMSARLGSSSPPTCRSSLHQSQHAGGCAAGCRGHQPLVGITAPGVGRAEPPPSFIVERRT
jgi:Periplasmic binding protein